MVLQWAPKDLSHRLSATTYVSRVPLPAKIIAGGHFFWHLRGANVMIYKVYICISKYSFEEHVHGTA